MSNLCYQHLARDRGLKIAMSNIPNAGRGLFAVKRFHPGEKIGHYTGIDTPIETEGECNGDYVMLVDHTPELRCIDAASTQADPVRYINHKTVSQTNVKFVNNIQNWEIGKKKPRQNNPDDQYPVCVVATKNIYGSPERPKELYGNYGNLYF